MSHVLINASNVRSPGAVSLARNLLAEMFNQKRADVKFTVISPFEIDLIGEADLDVVTEMKWAPYTRFNGYRRLKFEMCELKKIVDRVKPDVMFAMGNVSPRDTGVPLVALLQQLFIVSDPVSQPVYSLARWKMAMNRWMFKRTLGHADSVIVQTSFMRDQLVGRFDYSIRKISVIPNGVSNDLALTQKQHGVDVSVGKDIKLIYPSEYYAYKNHSMLLSLADMLRRDAAQNVSFIVTLSGSSSGSRKFLQAVSSSESGSFIENIGMVDERRLAELYSESSALFFPSLAESFGNPLLEAAAFGLPVLTADLPYAHDVMGDAALYFDPHDPVSVFNAIKTLADPDVRADLSERSRRRFEESPSWDEIASQYLDVILEAANKGEPHSR